MNFFDMHIGDYEAATAHLSLLEDAAYGRMLRIYYRTERPLPAELSKVCRLVRAASKPEREAVQAVLEEFFELQDDGWHQARCDEELRQFHEGQPEREARKANEETRLKRHRDERAALFKRLTDAGQHAPWNTKIEELRRLVDALQAQPETGSVTPPATAPATPATATHGNVSPPPTTHYPLPKEEIQARALSATPPEIDGPPHTPQAPPPPPDPQGDERAEAIREIAAAMKAAGVSRFQAGDSRALELYRQGASGAEFEALAREAVDKGARDPWSWVLKVLPERRAEAAAIVLAPTPVATDAWRASDEGVRAMAQQLGVQSMPGDTWDVWRARVTRAWQRAGEPAPQPTEEHPA